MTDDPVRPHAQLRRVEGSVRLFARHPGSVVRDAQLAAINPRRASFVTEGEIRIVIGDAIRTMPRDRAFAAIAGWTIVNDIRTIDVVASMGIRSKVGARPGRSVERDRALRGRENSH